MSTKAKASSKKTAPAKASPKAKPGKPPIFQTLDSVGFYPDSTNGYKTAEFYL